MTKNPEIKTVEAYESTEVGESVDKFKENVKIAWVEFVEDINDFYPFGGDEEIYAIGKNLNFEGLSPRMTIFGEFDDIGVNFREQIPKIKEAILAEVEKQEGFFQSIKTSIEITPEDVGMISVIENVGHGTSNFKSVSGLTNIKDNDFTIDLVVKVTDELIDSDPRFEVPVELKRIFGIRNGIAKTMEKIMEIDAGKQLKKDKDAYEKELADKQKAQTNFAEQYLNQVS